MNLSAVIPARLDTVLKVKLATWAVLLLIVFLSMTLLWMGVLFYFGVTSLLIDRALGYEVGGRLQELVAAGVGVACVLVGAFAYCCLLRGTLGKDSRAGGGGRAVPRVSGIRQRRRTGMSPITAGR